jgi:hypothetical protein
MNRRDPSLIVCACLPIGLLVHSAGCASQTIVPPAVTFSEEKPLKMDWSDWGATLSQAGSGERVNYQRMIEDPCPLDRFLARVAIVGPRSAPEQFPDRNGRLAYFINCYNATIIRSIRALARDEAAPNALPSDLETRFRFRIDGAFAAPADLRREVNRLAADDWRVRFALCDGHWVGPPLPRRPFLAELLDAQLNEVTRSALSDPRVVAINHGEFKQLLLWSGLYVIRDRLVEDYERRVHASDATILGVLLEWADRHRRETLNAAVGYDVAVMPETPESNATLPIQPMGEPGLFSNLGSFSLIRPPQK